MIENVVIFATAGVLWVMVGFAFKSYADVRKLRLVLIPVRVETASGKNSWAWYLGGVVTATVVLLMVFAIKPPPSVNSPVSPRVEMPATPSYNVVVTPTPMPELPRPQPSPEGSQQQDTELSILRPEHRPPIREIRRQPITMTESLPDVTIVPTTIPTEAPTPEPTEAPKPEPKQQDEHQTAPVEPPQQSAPVQHDAPPPAQPPSVQPPAPPPSAPPVVQPPPPPPAPPPAPPPSQPPTIKSVPPPSAPPMVKGTGPVKEKKDKDKDKDDKKS